MIDPSSRPRASALARMIAAATAALLLSACPAPPPVPLQVVVVIPTAPAPPPAPPVEDRAPPVCQPHMILLAGGALQRPNKNLQISDFCLDQHEVTAADYHACVERGACEAAELECDDEWTYGKPGMEDHPINCVSWVQANNFCRRAGKRLPTFEEWEWAAQGRDAQRRFAWGSADPDADQMCWAKADKPRGTCAVGTYPLSRTPEGVDDMFGNVWEWLAPPERNGAPNVSRGGSWHNDSIDTLEGENAGNFVQGFVRNDVVGFRCAAGS